MSLTLGQAQWLVHFMRNLPGHAQVEPSADDYSRAMLAQQSQARAMDHVDAQQAAVGAWDGTWDGSWETNDGDPY